MSGSGLSVLTRVRFHLRDREKGRQAFSAFEVYATIDARLKLFAGRLDLGDTWTKVADTNTLAITNATDTYILSVTPLHRLQKVRLASTQLELEILSQAGFEERRSGNVNPSANPGNPTACRLWEDGSQGLYIQLDPWPRGADDIEVLRSSLPVTVSDESSVIPLDDASLEGLAYDVAHELGLKMPPEERERRGLSPDVLAKWEQSVELAVHNHRVRRARGKASKRIRRGVRGY